MWYVVLMSSVFKTNMAIVKDLFLKVSEVFNKIYISEGIKHSFLLYFQVSLKAKIMTNFFYSFNSK